MKRDIAKEIVALSMIKNLNDEDVVNILSEYRGYDSVEEVKRDVELGELPSLRDKAILLLTSSEVPADIDKNIFEPLLIDYMLVKLSFSTNKYLELKLTELGRIEEVEGIVEEAGVCPCCQYLSIQPGENGLWDICSVCFWENGGDGSNHLSLLDAQRNFEEFGAIDKLSLKFVNPEGRLKYARKT